MLTQRISFDFPRDGDQVRRHLDSAGFKEIHIQSGAIVFRYPSAKEVLDHLLQSGAGTAYYDAIDLARRDEQEEAFVRLLKERHPAAPSFTVTHDYILGIASS